MTSTTTAKSRGAKARQAWAKETALARGYLNPKEPCPDCETSRRNGNVICTSCGGSGRMLDVCLRHDTVHRLARLARNSIDEAAFNIACLAARVEVEVAMKRNVPAEVRAAMGALKAGSYGEIIQVIAGYLLEIEDVTEPEQRQRDAEILGRAETTANAAE